MVVAVVVVVVVVVVVLVVLVNITTLSTKPDGSGGLQTSGAEVFYKAIESALGRSVGLRLLNIIFGVFPKL